MCRGMNVLGVVCSAVIVAGLVGCDKAERRRVVTKTESPMRGRLFDCKGRLLAMNSMAFEYHLDPKRIRVDKEEAARGIATALGLSYEDVFRKCNDEKSRYIFLAKREGFPTVEELRERGFGVQVNEIRMRKVADPKMAVLLGKVGVADGEGFLTRGYSGFELFHDEVLHGTGATNQVVVGPDGVEVKALTRNEPKSGCDVVLTIDRAIQDALQGVLDKYADTNDTGRAWGVVMEAKTGAIRAMADTCSASEFTNGIGSVYSSWYCYEPGSVLKPFTAAIAINSGLAKIDTKYSTARNDERYYKLPGDGSHVWPETMSVGDALVKSSNIVLGKLSYDVGQERMYLGLRAFGFGEKPGAGCASEAAGILPDCRKRPWDKASQSRVGIGQFIAVTALQLARGYAILANGGMDVRPYAVEKIVEPGGTVKSQHVLEATNRVVSADAASAVCRALERVPSVEGTARRAAVDGVRVAGKTGTAQRVVDHHYAEGLYRASFAGFFPTEDPKYVIVTTFETKKEEGRSMHQGGQRPALAFAEMVNSLR